MPHIILKKTFKIKPSGFQVANEKSFSFHGLIQQNEITAINQRLALLRVSGKATTLHFAMDAHGHYFASMNHDTQKHYEEDIVVMILDIMETLGYTFRFQYDSQTTSVKLTGDSFTSRELFIFTK